MLQSVSDSEVRNLSRQETLETLRALVVCIPLLCSRAAACLGKFLGCEARHEHPPEQPNSSMWINFACCQDSWDSLRSQLKRHTRSVRTRFSITKFMICMDQQSCGPFSGCVGTSLSALSSWKCHNAGRLSRTVLSAQDMQNCKRHHPQNTDPSLMASITRSQPNI